MFFKIYLKLEKASRGFVFSLRGTFIISFKKVYEGKFTGLISIGTTKKNSFSFSFCVQLCLPNRLTVVKISPIIISMIIVYPSNLRKKYFFFGHGFDVLKINCKRSKYFYICICIPSNDWWLALAAMKHDVLWNGIKISLETCYHWIYLYLSESKISVSPHCQRPSCWWNAKNDL